MTTNLNNILCTKLTGVGPKTASRLTKLNLLTAQDLLFHLPLRYEDRTKISPIRSLKIGEYATVVGTIEMIETIYHGRAKLICKLRDPTGYLQLCFFNFAKQRLQFRLQAGTRLYCYGETHWSGHTPEMTHPEYKILALDEAPPITSTLTPVYPTTEGLSQSMLRNLVTQALNIATKNQTLTEYFPSEILKQLQFPNLVDAINFVHKPPPNLNINAITSRDHPMRLRLIFEELLAEQLSLLKLRVETQNHAASAILWDSELATKFLASLSFTLTAAQQKVLQEIIKDLAKPKPMLRLLQGDVGCGKTVVAALAITQAVHRGFQAAILAPTEILAEQHFQNISHWLEPLNIKIILLTGKTTGKTRQSIIKNIADGTSQVIVGTHAIFQEKIKFKHLALIIIDEQHRFGVHQRLQLREKGLKNGQYPHQLIMTATPIPRTLAMTIYADLDCSIIDELPKGRAPITTIVISNKRRREVLEHVRSNCCAAKQAYWVCPLIEESENLQCQAAETLARDLTTTLPELHIGLIHGRMPSTQKEKIMAAFKKHEIDLLVATTVIEVGVDVPNASLMIIENAERLGLVQLHQLRGRIGRGTIASYCTLLYQTPLTETARQRLLLLRSSSDGFVLARKDLEMRGPGEVLGIKQTGLLQMRIADLISDQHLIPEVQKTAHLITQKYPLVVDPIIKRWIGAKEKYGNIV
ncbi:ATP-dependent DNA helicase RecG [Gammaproteobacteria bacterium]